MTASNGRLKIVTVGVLVKKLCYKFPAFNRAKPKKILFTEFIFDAPVLRPWELTKEEVVGRLAEGRGFEPPVRIQGELCRISIEIHYTYV